MARRLRQLVQALPAVLLLLVPAAFGAPTPSPTPGTPPPHTPPPAPVPTPPAPPLGKPKQGKPDEWAEARRLFEQLSPDQQKKFFDNLDQWKAMSPEEQELFRDRELFRREKIAQEIQEAITKSNLHLDNDQREVYALRYTQERRKIEEVLRKQTDKQRETMVTEMLTRLKGEFSSPPPPTSQKPSITH